MVTTSVSLYQETKYEHYHSPDELHQLLKDEAELLDKEYEELKEANPELFDSSSSTITTEYLPNNTVKIKKEKQIVVVSDGKTDEQIKTIAKEETQKLAIALVHGDESYISSYILYYSDGIIIYQNPKSIYIKTICPICYSEIISKKGAGNQTWSNDPLLTAKGLAGEGYIGFNQSNLYHIKQIQDKRTEQEEEVGISESNKTEFSSLNSNGIFNINKQHIYELRESTEKILEKVDKTKLEYFNYDAEGNKKETNQTEWYDVNLDNLQIRAIHIEDLRHPLPIEEILSYIYMSMKDKDTDLPFIVSIKDKENEYNKVVEHCSENLKHFACIDNDYIYKIEISPFIYESKKIKLTRQNHTPLSSIITQIDILSADNKRIKDIYGIACSDKYIHILVRLVSLDGWTNKISIIEIYKSDVYDEQGQKIHNVFDYKTCYHLCDSIYTGGYCFDHFFEGLGIVENKEFIYCGMYIPDRIKWITHSDCSPVGREPTTDDDGMVRIIKINQTTMAIESQNDIKAPEMEEIYEQIYGVHVPYTKCNYKYWKGTISHIKGKGLALDEQGNLYFSLMRYREFRDNEFVGYNTWDEDLQIYLAGYRDTSFKAYGSICKVDLNGTDLTSIVKNNNLCDIVIGVNDNLHCYGIKYPFSCWAGYSQAHIENSIVFIFQGGTLEQTAGWVCTTSEGTYYKYVIYDTNNLNVLSDIQEINYTDEEVPENNKIFKVTPEIIISLNSYYC